MKADKCVNCKVSLDEDSPHCISHEARRSPARSRSSKRWCSKWDCNRLGSDRYSLGLPAGRYCDPCWESSGYRKEGREGFDPAYAGERYDDDC